MTRVAAGAFGFLIFSEGHAGSSPVAAISDARIKIPGERDDDQDEK
jgi:hypothetical protein